MRPASIGEQGERVDMEFGVLGPLTVRRAGADIAIGSRRQRQVLAALLVHRGGVVSSDRLLAALWGDEPPATALRSLFSYISRLRGTLHADGDGVLVSRPPGYVLQISPGHTDAGRFESLLDDARSEAAGRPEVALARLDEALALWRGPAYAEFADEEFALAEATRLDELRLAAIEERFDAGLALGRHADLVGAIEAYVAQHPLREGPRGQLMLALYRCGRQAEALAVYRDFRRQLDEDLGVEPSTALRELETAILRQDHELDRYRDRDSVAGVAPPVERSTISARVRGNLPGEAASLVGRDHDVAAVLTALAQTRLLTLTGVGGVGKTRLAVHAASRAAGDFPDGAWWCELAPVTDGAAVVHAVAEAIGARQQPGSSIERSVLDFLSGRRLLLVVDNCEHVLDDAARLAEAVVRTCPEVTVLATSRLPLGVSGERIRPTAPLPVPDHNTPDAKDAPAVRLFVDRAKAVRPDLDLTEDNLAHISDVCRRLDGLPLALELAAARMRSLNPADLATRLSDRFGLLTTSKAAVAPRHRGLRAVVDWSYALLSPAEQRLFARLSVFAGGFTLTAAERVCGEDGLVDLLATLVDNSLVVAGSTAGEVRYSMLETLRAYGHDLLERRGEVHNLRRSHAVYYTFLADEAGRHLRGPEEGRWTTTLNADLDNLRAAHRWTVEQQDTVLALRLSAGLYHYAVYHLRDEVVSWGETALDLPDAATHVDLYCAVCGAVGEGLTLRGDQQRARIIAEHALSLSEDPDERRRIPPLKVMTAVTLYEGRLAECSAWAAELLRLARLYDDAPYVTEALLFQGLATTYSGDAAAGLVLADEHLRTAEALGNPSLTAWAMYNHAEALAATDPGAARKWYERSIAVAEAVNSPFAVNISEVGLAALLTRSGDLPGALRAFRSSVHRWHRMQVWHHQWTTLRNLVGLLVRIGAHHDAAVLLGALITADTDAYGADAESMRRAAAELKEALGPSVYDAATARGAGMTPDAIVTFALSAMDTAGMA